MIIQIKKHSVYYPAPTSQMSGFVDLSRRVRRFRAAVLVNRKSLK
jgi:hypothetical protein